MKKGFNIDVTRGQYMMLYNIMCEHNQMVNPQANPDFDLQTFDNLFQAITMAKETYCLLYTSPSPRDGLLSRMPSSA